ncbi:MAG: acetyl-CoA carboxylase carboxyltransferase subunit alpha [Phycisphaerales bacterium]|nr:acetyl-CoA carboxylase carboxyltransferase subunit alpha [Phycisphaerales bacterium]
MATFYQLDFEKPIVELERQIEAADNRLKAELAAAGATGEESTPINPTIATLQVELAKMRERHAAELTATYSRLTPWDTVRVARHPQRPQSREYISMICRDFAELHGDRRYGDDPAIVSGFARIGPSPGIKVMLIGHQKGKETAEKIACHFGCAHPEGYRKALLKMKLAEKFGVPIVTLVDTPGAYPGLGAEQRGQAEAIAVNMLEMSRLRTPIVSVVIGEGGSGGALGIAVADRVAMMQHSWYSVISPEGCAAILWKEANEQTNQAAARSLKLTAADNLSLGIINEIIPEPVGGAHRDQRGAATNLLGWVLARLNELSRVPMDELLQQRYERFRKMGSYLESHAEPQAN